MPEAAADLPPPARLVKRERAVIALVTEPTIPRAAESAGISEKTLRRWLEDPGFVAEYRRARRETFSHAMSATQRYAPAAVVTLAKIMGDASAPYAARVSAATSLLKFSRDSIELDDLAERLEALELAQKSSGPRASARPGTIDMTRATDSELAESLGASYAPAAPPQEDEDAEGNAK